MLKNRIFNIARVKYYIQVIKSSFSGRSSEAGGLLFGATVFVIVFLLQASSDEDAATKENGVFSEEADLHSVVKFLGSKILQFHFVNLHQRYLSKYLEKLT